MSRYEREYGTEWTTLDRDGGTERAYAIGVAEKLGEYNREELEAIYTEMDTAYDRSMVELAYSEGRQEATDVARQFGGEAEAVWAELVESVPVSVDPDDVPTGGRDGLPEALEPGAVLDRTEALDSTEAIDRPSFLDN